MDDLPCELIQYFDSRFPLFLGGLLPSEEGLSFLQARVKKHRWHRKVLKTNDPLIFSVGWRRFQSLPLYSMADPHLRLRMLKYTPAHMHCTATFYGLLIRRPLPLRDLYFKLNFVRSNNRTNYSTRHRSYRFSGTVKRNGRGASSPNPFSLTRLSALAFFPSKRNGSYPRH